MTFHGDAREDDVPEFDMPPSVEGENETGNADDAPSLKLPPVVPQAAALCPIDRFSQNCAQRVISDAR